MKEKLLVRRFLTFNFFSLTVVGNSLEIWKKCLKTWSFLLICRANSVLSPLTATT
jgi:hypothetical protein